MCVCVCVCVYIYPLSLYFLPIEVTTVHWLELPVLYSTFSLVICIIQSSVNMSSPISQFILFPLPPFGVHTFIIYICVYISALQIGSSVPFFQIPHICVNIQYLFFPFLLHSMTVSRSIHVSANCTISFLFMAE